jgi:hypothetical protein
MHGQLTAATSFEQDDSDDDEHEPIGNEQPPSMKTDEEHIRNIAGAMDRMTAMMAVKHALPMVPSGGEQNASSYKPKNMPGQPDNDADNVEKDDQPTYLLVTSPTMGWRKRLLSDVRIGRKADFKLATTGNAPTVAADKDAPATTLDQRDVGRPQRPKVVSRVNQTVNRDKVLIRYNTANVSSISLKRFLS